MEHSWRGDLKLVLVAPDGSQAVLHNRSGGSADHIKGTYGVDLVSVDDLAPLASVTQTGMWTLKVSDHARRDVGSIQSFQLQFAP